MEFFANMDVILNALTFVFAEAELDTTFYPAFFGLNEIDHVALRSAYEYFCAFMESNEIQQTELLGSVILHQRDDNQLDEANELVNDEDHVQTQHTNQNDDDDELDDIAFLLQEHRNEIRVSTGEENKENVPPF